MFKYVLSVLLLTTVGAAHANDLRFTYIDGGFSFIDQKDVLDDEFNDELDVSGALLRIRGNVGFGRFFYIPASIESAATDYESTYCSQNNGCETDEYSTGDLTLTAGAGMHFDLGPIIAIYFDASLVHMRHTFDEDGGYDDEDETKNYSGNQQRVGFRIVPVSFLEFDVQTMRRRMDGDFFFRDIDMRIHTIAAQFNITKSIGVGVDWRQEVFKSAPEFDKLNYVGGYFRYSFK